jgi:hypothetical protein
LSSSSPRVAEELRQALLSCDISSRLPLDAGHCGHQAWAAALVWIVAQPPCGLAGLFTADKFGELADFGRDLAEHVARTGQFRALPQGR